MQSFLRVLRYIVFGLFIICNALVASVAVWNHSLAQSIAWNSHIDIYLAFLGCFGLAHIFTVIFVELAYRHGITGRVWFECSWVGLFWTMYLAGASAVTSLSPIRACDLQSRELVDDICVSIRLLLAFTWIMTAILLSYFFLLVIASLVHLKHDSRIFHCYIHKFPWGDFRRSIPSAPASPAPPAFLTKMPSIVAPKPQRPAHVAIYTHHGGLGSEYEIESYATPMFNSNRPLPASSPTPPTPVIYSSYDIPQPEAEEHAPPPPPPPPTLYPKYIQSALTSEPLPPGPPLPPQTQTHRPLQLHQPPLSEPPPLGAWPRLHPPLPNARARNKPVFTAPPVLAPATPATALARNTSFPPRPRPSGPRQRLADGDARFGVDLPNLSSHRPSR